MIELAFLLVFLLLISVGVTEIGRTFWYYDAMQKAARNGARCVSRIENVTQAGSAAAVDACRSQAMVDTNTAGVTPKLNLGNVSVDYSYITVDGVQVVEYVTFTLTQQMRWIWRIGEALPAPGESWPLTARATMPYMR